MIGLDTNVLVRYLVNDDAEQCRKATAIIRKHRKPGEIFVCNIVWVELEWVLSSIYNFSQGQIRETFSRLAQTKQIVVENRDAFMRALKRYVLGSKDFSDLLIGESGKIHNILTYTFEKRLKKDPNFIVV